MKSRYKSFRSTLAIILILLVIAGFGYTLYEIQIVNNEYYAAQNNAVKTYTVSLEAARGIIVDRNGNPLVTNRQGNAIVLSAVSFPSKSENELRNTIILNLIQLFEKNGEEYVSNLPLTLNKKGNIVFTDDESEISTMKSEDMFNLQNYATAQNCYDVMVEEYGLTGYDTETALKIANIRYELTRLRFSYSNPVTIADDVSDETVARIKEDTASYLGADVQVTSYREYTDSTLAPHILGTVRDINAEEYEELKDAGYNITDEIGESGIESAMESELRGTPGELTITIDAEGSITQEVTKEPIQGNTVVLTIDRDLQQIAQEKLKEICDKVDVSSSAGAVVVEDVNSGEILAAASYPTYDLADYYEKYSKLASNERNPLWSRFALGTYAPGSTFKPAMALAALESGTITESTVFTCTSSFRYYDITFGCTDYHGGETVRTALRDSCNIFFYNCASKMGISTMNEYASMLGLGQKTGVEISEASGMLAGPANSEKLGTTWQAGDAIQAAIGQSDNLFTPLQLCNYTATIANGGTRYEAHFVKSIINTATGTVTDKEATVAEKLDVSEQSLSVVQEGMRLVSTNGAPSSVFSHLDVTTASKTGTSQVIKNGEKRNNGFLISYAPYENPEISIASVVELAGSGTSTAEITASIMNYWFSENSGAKKNQQSGSLLD